MKCQEQLYRDIDYDVPFCTGYILRSHVASVGKGMGFEHLTSDTACYLSEWKHVLVYGRRISTATYRVSLDLPVMDFERKLEDPCQDLPETAREAVNFTVEKTEDMGRDGLVKLCHSAMPSILSDGGEVDMRRAAERYREVDMNDPDKQESL